MASRGRNRKLLDVDGTSQSDPSDLVTPKFSEPEGVVGTSCYCVGRDTLLTIVVAYGNCGFGRTGRVYPTDRAPSVPDEISVNQRYPSGVVVMPATRPLGSCSG